MLLLDSILLAKTKVWHSDLHVMKGEIPFASPCVIGHEIIGEVVEYGPLTDHKIIKRFPIGSCVVGAFIMPCGTYSYCAKGHDDLCEDFFAFNRAKGTLYDGQTRLFLRHDGCAVFTAYGAMAHAVEIRPCDSIAVIGIGGVGTSCLQIASVFGASDIIAVDVQDDKLQKAKTLGATHIVNAAKEDGVERIREITGGMGVDVAVEALGCSTYKSKTIWDYSGEGERKWRSCLLGTSSRLQWGPYSNHIAWDTKEGKRQVRCGRSATEEVVLLLLFLNSMEL